MTRMVRLEDASLTSRLVLHSLTEFLLVEELWRLRLISPLIDHWVTNECRAKFVAKILTNKCDKFARFFTRSVSSLVSVQCQNLQVDDFLFLINHANNLSHLAVQKAVQETQFQRFFYNPQNDDSAPTAQTSTLRNITLGSCCRRACGPAASAVLRCNKTLQRIHLPPAVWARLQGVSFKAEHTCVIETAPVGFLRVDQFFLGLRSDESRLTKFRPIAIHSIIGVQPLIIFWLLQSFIEKVGECLSVEISTVHLDVSSLESAVIIQLIQHEAPRLIKKVCVHESTSTRGDQCCSNVKRAVWDLLWRPSGFEEELSVQFASLISARSTLGLLRHKEVWTSEEVRRWISHWLASRFQDFSFRLRRELVLLSGRSCEPTVLSPLRRT